MTQVEENPYEVQRDLTEAPEVDFGWTDDGEFIDRIDTLVLPEICYDTGKTRDLARRVQNLGHHQKHKWLTHGVFYGGGALHVAGFVTQTNWLRGLASWCCLIGIVATITWRKTVKVTSFEHKTTKREREHRQYVIYSMLALMISLSALLILNQPIPGSILAIISLGAIATYDNHRFKLRHLKAKPAPDGAYAIYGFSDEFHETRREQETSDSIPE